MKGYGRGYYGDAQIAPIQTRGGRSWGTIAVVVGLGAAVAWIMWPRAEPEAPQAAPGGEPPPPPSPTPPPPSPSPQGEVLPAHVRDREALVVAAARDLRAAGAKVELAPHLQHLAARVEAV